LAALELKEALEEAAQYVYRENPDLFGERSYSSAERTLILQTLEWARTLLAEGHSLEHITEMSVQKSSLLRRIRLGKSAMTAPPPKSFGQPWHDVLESHEIHSVACDGRVTTVAELLGMKDSSETVNSTYLIGINGCLWNVVKVVEPGSSFVVAFAGHEQRFSLCRDLYSAWSLRRLTTRGLRAET
jgi:hypothetical protein